MSTNPRQPDALCFIRRTIRRLVPCLCTLVVAAPAVAASPVLDYSTYLGGNGVEMFPAVAVDADGNVYVTGTTDSRNFPISGSSLPFLGGAETYVTKLTPEGSLVYSTFLGIAGEDFVGGIAVDSAGYVYVCGSLRSSSEAFVAKLSPAGNHLEYLKILESGEWPGWAEGHGIAVDPAGNAYVTGHAISPHFPAERPIGRLAEGSGATAYVVKLDPSGKVVYATYLGGSSPFFPTAIAVDAAGHAYVTGSTDSLDYPAVFVDGSPYWSGVPMSIFVVKLDLSGERSLYTTLLPGNSHFDGGYGIAIDDAGQAYVLADASSTNLPTVNAFQAAHGGFPDTYVFKLSATGSIVYASYLGGSDVEVPGEIAVDSRGSAYVTGHTFSFDFPLHDPVDATCGNVAYCRESFVAKLSPDGSELAYSTYLGGSAPELSEGIALDPEGRAWIVGLTYSSDFPTVNALQPSFGGDVDAFVARISTSGNTAPECTRATASPSTIWPPNGKLVPVSLGVTDPDGDAVTLRITGITHDEPVAGSDSSGIGTATPRVRAMRDGKGDGRVYHILFEAADTSEASCTGEVTVCVPHHRNKACVDGSPLPI